MITTTTAEFRAIKKENIKNLIMSAGYKKIERGGVFGLFKKVEYEDNFETYLEQNTSLIDEMSGKGFLLFDDIAVFLKKIKSIDLKQPEYKNLNIDLILEREENAYFLDSDYIKHIVDQFSKVSIEKEELMEFNNMSCFDIPMSEMIPYQQDQIRQLSLILNQFKDEVLYIRCELSPQE